MSVNSYYLAPMLMLTINNEVYQVVKILNKNTEVLHKDNDIFYLVTTHRVGFEQFVDLKDHLFNVLVKGISTNDITVY